MNEKNYVKFDFERVVRMLKYETFIRQIYARMFSGVMPFYIVNEFPRSGGSWISTMLGEALNVPFPRKRPPKFESCILQAHHISPLGLKNVVPVFRDGRDVMVSWYSYCFFENIHEQDMLVNSVAKDLNFKDRDDVVNNLPVFLEWAFQNKRHPGFSWAQFVDVWHGYPGSVPVRYEDFRNNGTETLINTVRKLTNFEMDPIRAAQVIENNSFNKLSGRKAGEEVRTSLMRKGIVGDWEQSFSLASREIFDHYAGEQLIKLGYESNRSWVGAIKL